MKAIINISPVQQVKLGINIGLMGYIQRSLKNITQDGEEFFTTVKIQGVNVVIYNDVATATDYWCVDINKSIKAN